MLNIYKLNLTNLLKKKKKVFKNFLNNNFTNNNLLNINNLNLTSFLKEINSLKKKSKIVKTFSINKFNKTLLIKKKLLIIRILFIKRNS